MNSLKPDDMITYRSGSDTITARVVEIYTEMFTAQILQINGQPFNGINIQGHLFSMWERSNFQLLKSRVKLIDRGSHYTTELIK